MIKVTSEQYIKLSYDCVCGYRLRLTKHRTLYEKELREGKIEKKKVCEKCNSKIMKLKTVLFTK